MKKALLTVIICTFNREYILGECLESLCQKLVSASDFNVLVVDNGSTDATQSIVQAYVGRFPRLDVVYEKQQGLSYARNRGLAEVETPWVAFLDDDATASAGWVSAILQTIEKDDFDLFGGPYSAWHRFGPPPKWFSPHWESTETEFAVYGPVASGIYPTGGNFACKVEMLREAGGFSPSLGMSGKKIAYAEETMLFRHLEQSGCRIGVVPEMRIAHCVLPHKYSWLWQVRSAYARGRDEPVAAGHATGGMRDGFLAVARIGKILLINAPRLFWTRQNYWGTTAVLLLRDVAWHCGRLFFLLTQKK